MIYSLGDLTPDIDESCFIAESADLIGNVTLKVNVSVWFNCVIRADNAAIVIGQGSNIQDGSVLHVDPGMPIELDENVTVGHGVTLHGCKIGRNSLVGINAVVLNGVKIGEGCVIGANSLLTEGMRVPDNSLVMGSPAKVVKSLDQQAQQLLLQGAQHYVAKIPHYKEKLSPLNRKKSALKKTKT